MKEQGSAVSHLRNDGVPRNLQGAGVARAPARTIVAVLVVAIVLACAEREMSGARDGSLLALLASYAAKVLGGAHN